MYESVRSRAKRVLVIGTMDDSAKISPEAALAPDGMLILMESDPARAQEARRYFSRAGLDGRSTVIAGDPRRMLYKLAGPFDVIFCGNAHLSLLDMLEKLLAPGGVLIANDQTSHGA